MLGKTVVSAALASVAAAQSLTQVLTSNNQTSMLATVLGQVPDLVSSLGNMTGNITLLAPSNNALNALLTSPGGQTLASNQAALTALLSYHVLKGSFPAAAFNGTPAFAPTTLGNGTYSHVSGGQRVEGLATNGTVYIYSGFDNNSTVIQPNITFNNGSGLIHVIDQVLTLPPPATTLLLAANLTALYGGATALNLSTSIDTLSDVTIFAPSNAAFQTVGDASGITANVLEYHLVTGARPYYSTNLMNGTMLPTLNGRNLTITKTGNATFVNDARIIRSNLLISGGVVHVIDNVLNPANSTQSPSASATSGMNAFGATTTATVVPFTTLAPTQTTTVAVAPTTVAVTTSSAGGVPMATGAVGAAALFGAGAWIMNL